ncbi:hypothetical protein DM02DRAFT_650141 [Periconia macrospinosa]|uniref:Uncharacterized protein n=1 Tax=Periconia macrospinosa TaxID=97972 RepID=A0A2V1E835_9PLEO|nr:hypothetical protein DM02DRAFT_650141 [Periconia macrospinosa]
MLDPNVQSSSPLLRLPYELRLMIYEYLLLPSTAPSTTNSTSVTNLLPDYHTYHSSDTNEDPFTLSVRTIDPYLSYTSRSWRKRSMYHIRTGPFLTSTTPTTYRVLLSPFTAHLRLTIPSLLPLNRQIHAEAATLLYSTYKFSFHTCIEAAVPFFSDLTIPARRSIRRISITKKGLPYIKEFDRAEWAALCKYLGTDDHISIQKLNLAVVAGRPGEQGWDNVVPITKEAFGIMSRMSKEWGAGGNIDMDWVEQLFKVKGLKDVRVRALVEHCPGPVSEMMAFWIAFSASIEGGFAEWVKDSMVGEVYEVGRR